MIELIPIAALEHFDYCPRQCALMYVEQVWDDNLLTVLGTQAHARVDQVGGRDRSLRFAVPLWSDRLGLIGRGDVIQLEPQVMPIEHKVGTLRVRGAEDLQLCAQALCLEEMLGVEVTQGAIFYRGSQRRRLVAIDRELRERTEQLVDQVRRLLSARDSPPALNDRRCVKCSLRMACLPGIVEQRRRYGQLRHHLFQP